MEKEQIIVEYSIKSVGGEKFIATLDDITETSNKAGKAVTAAFAEKQIDSATERLTKFNTAVEKTATEFSSAKAELIALTKQITSGALQGKDLDIAKRRAGELKDRIGDVRDEINRLASDTRVFDTLVEGARGVAAAFTLAQGAAGLFGEENKDVQKAILRTQSALALLQGAHELATIATKEGGLAAQLYGGTLQIVDGIQKRFAISSAAAWAAATAGISLLVAGAGYLISQMISGADTAEDVAKVAEELRKRKAEEQRIESETNKRYLEDQQTLYDEFVEMQSQKIKRGGMSEIAAYGERIAFIRDRMIPEYERAARTQAIFGETATILIRRANQEIEMLTEKTGKVLGDLMKKQTAEMRDADASLAEGVFRTGNHIKEFADRVASAKQSTDEPLITEKSVDETAKNAEDAANAEVFWINYSLEQYRKAQEEKAQLTAATFAAASQAAASLASIVSSSFARETQELEQQKQLQLASVGNNTKQREKIEREFAIKSAEIRRKQAIAEKAFALANIGINTASAIVRLLANPALPTAAPLIALTVGTAAIQTAAVLAQPLPEIPKFKEGVIGFKGKGSETSDENLVLISNNESVIKAKATSKYRDELQAANDLSLDSFIYHKYLLPVLKQKDAAERDAAQYDDWQLRQTIKAGQESERRNADRIVTGILSGMREQNYLSNRHQA